MGVSKNEGRLCNIDPKYQDPPYKDTHKKDPPNFMETATSEALGMSCTLSLTQA